MIVTIADSQIVDPMIKFSSFKLEEGEWRFYGPFLTKDDVRSLKKENEIMSNLRR